jgi:hypothetical protein
MPGLQPVSTLQRLTQSSPLWKRPGGLYCPRAPSAHSASNRVTRPWCIRPHGSQLPVTPLQLPALQPGNLCAAALAATWSKRSGASAPRVCLSYRNSTHFPFRPFQGTIYPKGVVIESLGPKAYIYWFTVICLYTVIGLGLCLIIYNPRHRNCLLLEIVLHYVIFLIKHPYMFMLYVLVYVFLCCLILTCFIFSCLVTDIGFVERILMYVFM